MVCCGGGGRGGWWCCCCIGGWWWCIGGGICLRGGGGCEGTVGGGGGGTEVGGKGGMIDLELFIFNSDTLLVIGGRTDVWLVFIGRGGGCTLCNLLFNIGGGLLGNLAE